MIEIGSIFKCNLNAEDGITPKGGYDSRSKFFVVIGNPEYGYYVAYVIVNSEYNTKFITTRELLDAQFPLKREDYPEIFKKKETSYLDLSKIRKMDAERLNREGELMGKLTERDLELVMTTLRESDLLSPKEKKYYGLQP